MPLMEVFQERLPGQYFPSSMAIMQKGRDPEKPCKHKQPTAKPTALGLTCPRCSQAHPLRRQLSDLMETTTEKDTCMVYICPDKGSLLREAHVVTHLQTGLIAQGRPWLGCH